MSGSRKKAGQAAGGPESASTQETDNKRGIEGQGTGTGAATTGEPIQEDIKGNLVEDEKPNIVEIPIPKLDNAEEKSKAPKRDRSKAGAAGNKKDSSIVGQAEINSLICGVFGLVSLKAGQHWNVTPQEAATLSKPIENILKKFDLVDKVSNISDGMMLILAAATITIPRVIITVELEKQKKAEQQNKKALNVGGDQVGGKQESSGIKENRGNDNTRVYQSQSNNGQSIKAISSPIIEQY